LVIQFSILRAFLFLFGVASAFYLIPLFVNVNLVHGYPFSDYMERSATWAPLMVRSFSLLGAASLAGAFVCRYFCRCQIELDMVFCRNTLGKKVKFKVSEIAEVKIVRLPLVPMAKLKISSEYWSVWVPRSVVNHVAKNA